ncbi:MAG: sulfurtransferase complex subunit TusB [Candidatus Thiodiazotropha sp.]
MATLHTVNKSPFEKSSMESCLAHAKDGSAVLLYEDGIYGAVKGTSVADKVTAMGGVKFYVLGPDLKARGISDDKLLDGVEVVDYAKFVDLAATNDKVQAWV